MCPVDANRFPNILLYATFIVMSKEVQLIMVTVRLADIPINIIYTWIWNNSRPLEQINIKLHFSVWMRGGRGHLSSAVFKKEFAVHSYTYVSQSPNNVSIMETLLSRKKEKEKKRSNKSSLISLKCFPSERERIITQQVVKIRKLGSIRKLSLYPSVSNMTVYCLPTGGWPAFIPGRMTGVGTALPPAVAVRPGWCPARMGLAIWAAWPRRWRFFWRTASLIRSTSYW